MYALFILIIIIVYVEFYSRSLNYPDGISVYFRSTPTFNVFFYLLSQKHMLFNKNILSSIPKPQDHILNTQVVNEKNNSNNLAIYILIKSVLPPYKIYKQMWSLHYRFYIYLSFS